MANLLIVYAGTGGHTRRVAWRIAEVAHEFGHAADVADLAVTPAFGLPCCYEAVVVAAPVYRRRHPAAVARFVRDNLDALEHVPTAFFSVSLAAAGKDPRRRAAARKCANGFLRAAGWRPGMVRVLAGALPYSRYGRLTRLRMRLAAWRAGADTDASRDYEYTDWEALRRDVELFLTHAVPRAEEAPHALEPAGAGA